eukprot:CAMPEP_0171108286 /NCGR_PEP_ID=MMETSP0766_2-20121228/68584_1 /TAXON_ID=439317 /ORGANISM="Gambierdiscus australes, Strain CAWD 149" /LENGTH=54 /DNA_ID=CAMNT_0011569777 /DNA_START=11 /DNA_END=175 /DNA_ORIENTATION=-
MKWSPRPPTLDPVALGSSSHSTAPLSAAASCGPCSHTCPAVLALRLGNELSPRL